MPNISNNNRCGPGLKNFLQLCNTFIIPIKPFQALNFNSLISKCNVMCYLCCKLIDLCVIYFFIFSYFKCSLFFFFTYFSSSCIFISSLFTFSNTLRDSVIPHVLNPKRTCIIVGENCACQNELSRRNVIKMQIGGSLLFKVKCFLFLIFSSNVYFEFAFSTKMMASK